MPVDDNAPTPDAPTDAPAAPDLAPEAAPASPGRRRRNRSWSTPAASPVESFERPLTERDWNQSTAVSAPAAPLAPATAPRPDAAPPAPGRTPIAAPPPVTLAATPPAAPAEAGADVAGVLAELRADVAGLRRELAAVAAQAGRHDTTLVTGGELAASIDALGTTLGTGLAALLTEHRNLLARDLEAAADRILEELGQRLRTASTQTADGVEERVRHISAKGFGDLSAQLDLRLDQVEADVSGLRAVMLEIPDQTTIVERLDQLVGSAGPRRRTPLRPGASVDAEWEDEEPVIPVTAPAPRASKAPLRAKPAPEGEGPDRRRGGGRGRARHRRVRRRQARTRRPRAPHGPSGRHQPRGRGGQALAPPGQAVATGLRAPYAPCAPPGRCPGGGCGSRGA